MRVEPLMASERKWSAMGVSLVIVALAAAMLWWMGQPWWCAAGDVSPWSWDVWSDHNSQHLIDPYSFSHFQHGLILYGALLLIFRGAWSGARLAAAVGLQVTWEVVENTPPVIEHYRESTISLHYYGDSILNSLADIAMCLAGYGAASLVAWWVSAAAFVVIELTMVALIRDSLLLNVLMLAWPIEAMKQWQMGG